MSETVHLQEYELDGALNALFLEKYSKMEDENLARFFMDQNYDVAIDSKKEAELLARLGGNSGGKNIIFVILAGLLAISAIYYFTNGGATKNTVGAPAQIQNTVSVSPEKTPVDVASAETTPAPGQKMINPASPSNLATSTPPAASVATEPVQYAPQPVPEMNTAKNDSTNEKELPYFKKAGLEYFSKIKEQVLKKVLKIDDRLYGKTEPGATFYKAREVTVPPFVMANFPVTNMEYKTFLADLAMQGRVEDMKKCLPKGELWKQYGCFSLAKDYFENEAYNDFPVVNVSKEACNLYCEWLEEETNAKFEEEAKSSKVKGAKKKQVIVRLPYDYEWIYSADAANALVPDCGGYNTIYDPSEGLVDKDFFKRTSQLSKRDLKKETRMDKLSDINRFGMTEAEIIAIYREAMNYNDGKAKADPSDPANYPNNVEACCLAGHVCELIKTKDGGMTLRGCCWKDKDEYLKMADAYTKNGASPFVGFRIAIFNADKGTNRNPFWN
ncbi:MAG: SUMF1/EgtB/PvdO family nonheme iron enzyme [Bacteroidia bacterium]